MKGEEIMRILTKAAGKDASLEKGGVFFQTFRELLKEREALDHQILRLQGRLFNMVEKKTLSSPSSENETSKRKYVPRMDNKTILRDSIREVMATGKPMGMKEILFALEKTGSYRTKSKYLYTMVNNKLNRDPQIKKVSRGVFEMNMKAGRPKKAS